MGHWPQTNLTPDRTGTQKRQAVFHPVSLVEDGHGRWLVAPYGEVSWVKNARAAGEVTLTRGQKMETVNIVEVGPEESGPVLKKYVKLESITQPYFEVSPDAPLEAFVKRHAIRCFFLRRRTQ